MGCESVDRKVRPFVGGRALKHRNLCHIRGLLERLVERDPGAHEGGGDFRRLASGGPSFVENEVVDTVFPQPGQVGDGGVKGGEAQGVPGAGGGTHMAPAELPVPGFPRRGPFEPVDDLDRSRIGDQERNIVLRPVFHVSLHVDGASLRNVGFHPPEGQKLGLGGRQPGDALGGEVKCVPGNGRHDEDAGQTKRAAGKPVRRGGQD
ncbi:MAG: hypothetical protein MI744_08385, partial [Pseudomonadales bacterium]|nr:hypothetical protein [Pseudomonadales bacterium]